MKKPLISLFALSMLGACATDNGLKPGEVTGTNIGRILVEENGVRLNDAQISQMNSEIERTLYLAYPDTTVRWQVGYDVRMRILEPYRDRRDRNCLKFRHGHFINGVWDNGTAIACRSTGKPWYLISSQWDDNLSIPADDPAQGNDDFDPSPRANGGWNNLADELSGRPAKANDAIKW